jgi:hypothetical protein
MGAAPSADPVLLIIIIVLLLVLNLRGAMRMRSRLTIMISLRLPIGSPQVNPLGLPVDTLWYGV